MKLPYVETTGRINMWTLLISTVLCVASTHGEECGNDEGSTRILNLSVVSKRNSSGLWTTNFSATKDDSNLSKGNNITVDITHIVSECKGKRTVQIRGVLADLIPSSSENNIEQLLFHSKCGTNVAVTNGGRTLQKINLDEPLHSVAFTNRPLNDNEIFEIKLAKKHNKFSYSLGIGVTTHSPEDITIPKHINHVQPPSWAMYHGNLYRNGSEFLKNYGKDLNALVVGDRVGVMRSNTGSLHFFVNGIDQGPAASSVPYPVYGLLELWYNAAEATIVVHS